MTASSHGSVLAFAAAALMAATVWIGGLSYLGARRAQAGDDLIAVFAPGEAASEVASLLARAPVRRFEPLGMGNAWIVQAGAAGLAPVLERRGALLVLRAKGPLHFALGCGIR